MRNIYFVASLTMTTKIRIMLVSAPLVDSPGKSKSRGMDIKGGGEGGVNTQLIFAFSQ